MLVKLDHLPKNRSENNSQIFFAHIRCARPAEEFFEKTPFICIYLGKLLAPNKNSKKNVNSSGHLGDFDSHPFQTHHHLHPQLRGALQPRLDTCLPHWARCPLGSRCRCISPGFFPQETGWVETGNPKIDGFLQIQGGKIRLLMGCVYIYIYIYM